MANNQQLDITIVNSITLAQILGITDRRVRQLVEETVLEPVARGKYELIKSVQRYCTYLRQKAEMGDNKKSSQADHDMEKAKHEKAKREMAELKLQVMRGELHRAADVEMIMTDMISKAKTRLLVMPSKTAPLIIGHKDLAKVQSILMKSVEEALQEISEYNPDLFINDSVMQGDEDERE